ncbi:hypothetical protein RclHR1_01640003 [Rhizophagus clarus]|uniref:Uncharacterized protein n=1 Tax=Rhizophagus clarus TaxID=94130 RepID=A0A2Z6QY76_9GLOM|nr:hypothetical protein RclHR1_01640003 [Rhizophagus clarus]
MDKLHALSRRTSLNNSSNKGTSTYIKFSFKKMVIYFGFYFRCTPERREHEHCKNAAHRVFSNERWRCAHHSKFIHTPQKSAYIVKNDPQYKKQADNIADNQIDKRVHSTRLGISYDVTIRKFKQFDKKTQDQLRGEGKYFKLYKNLQFDIKRSKEQIKRWNRVTRRVYHCQKSSSSNGQGEYTPMLISDDPSDVVIKTIHHLSWKRYRHLKQKTLPLLQGHRAIIMQ